MTRGMAAGAALTLALAMGCDDGGSTGEDGAGGTGGSAEPAGGADAPGDEYNEWGPSARVTTFSATAEAAEASPCPVKGSQGTRFAGLLTALQTDLQTLVDADETGAIPIPILLQAQDFPASPFALNVILGEESEAGFMIDPRSLSNGAPVGVMPGYQADATGNFTGGPNTFNYAMPFGQDIVQVRFDVMKATGNIQATPEGVSVSGMYLAGYLTQTTVEGLIGALRDSCNGEGPSETCASAANFLNSENAAATAVALAGGYDAKVDGGADSDCQGEECNAMSVCVKVAASPTVIQGIGQGN
jgi:hypothetical protein